MRADDPRRVGHRLIYGRVEVPRGGGSRGAITTGRCECSPQVWFRSLWPPSKGGLGEVRVAHDRHVAEVEGPALPELTNGQKDALLSYDPDVGGLTDARARSVRALLRLGLVQRRTGVDYGTVDYVLTESGVRAVGLLRRAADNAVA